MQAARDRVGRVSLGDEPGHEPGLLGRAKHRVIQGSVARWAISPPARRPQLASESRPANGDVIHLAFIVTHLSAVSDTLSPRPEPKQLSAKFRRVGCTTR
jgi:hypothetical protein